jgi:hypothetical protein
MATAAKGTFLRLTSDIVLLSTEQHPEKKQCDSFSCLDGLTRSQIDVS